MSFLYLWKSVVQYFCEDGLYINILSSIIRLSIKVGFDFPKTLVTILLPFFWQEKAPFKTLTCPNSRDSSLFFMEKHPISPCLYRMDFQAVWHASVATICSAWGAWASAPLDSWLWRCQDLRFRRCGRSCGNSWIFDFVWFCMIWWCVWCFWWFFISAGYLLWISIISELPRTIGIPGDLIAIDRVG